MQQDAANQRPNLFIQAAHSTESLNPISEFGQQIYAQIDNYSITPTTFQSRTFFATDSEFDIEKAIEEKRKKVAEEIAKIEKSERVGETLKSLLKQIKDAPSDFDSLNTVADTLLTIINEQFTSEPLTSYLDELNKFQDFLARYKIELLAFKDLYKYGVDSVVRFGVNTANMDSDQT